MESENHSHSPESKEQPERFNQLTVNLIRHGESTYRNISPDLTDRGFEQIRSSANELVGEIDDNEKIVIWNSPAVRTQDSAKVIRETLEGKGIAIAKQKEISSLRPMRIDDLEFVQTLFKEVADQGRPDTAFMEHPEFAKEEHDNMETRPQVEKRVDRVVNYLRYLVEHVDLQGQPLRIIMVSHFELAEPLAQEVFGFQNSFKQGENLEINMLYDKEKKTTEIRFAFRGQVRGPFSWDNEKRELVGL